MAVDYIRHPYKTRMRLRKDSDEETEVQWFFCLPGAKWYPGYTRFASGIWAQYPEVWTGVGEVAFAGRTHVNGKPPKLGLSGQGFCGSHYVIEEGASIGTPSLPTWRNGLAKCCPGLNADVGVEAAPGLFLRDNPCGWDITDWKNDFAVSLTLPGLLGDITFNGPGTLSVAGCTGSALLTTTDPVPLGYEQALLQWKYLPTPVNGVSPGWHMRALVPVMLFYTGFPIYASNNFSFSGFGGSGAVGQGDLTNFFWPVVLPTIGTFTLG